SVQVHACHGPARQVEVLREVLADLLDDDPTLEPRDILVMCPDIEGYASLFEAGFGLAEVVHDGHPAHGLRVRLADRGLARTNPLLDLAARVVEIAGGRATASEVLDLASTDVVRRRFALSDDDPEQVAQWVAESGTRWGLAADLRGPYALADYPHNTWRLGLDRLLLGVGMAEAGQRRFGGAPPPGDVGSGEIDLAGRLAEPVDRVETGGRAPLAARPPAARRPAPGGGGRRRGGSRSWSTGSRPVSVRCSRPAARPSTSLRWRRSSTRWATSAATRRGSAPRPRASSPRSPTPPVATTCRSISPTCVRCSSSG